ncbi:MAG: hypothetical protein HY681_00390 [Chloroflexi bacterium]|nr:hypothetical protein [Chloroflexota bacterium]
MTTASDTESALAFVRAEFQRLMQDVKVSHIPGMEPFMFGVYGFMLQRGGAGVLVAITWEVLKAARNDPAYREGEFRGSLSKALEAIKGGSSEQWVCILSTRGLRIEASEEARQQLFYLGEAEEATAMEEQFFARQRKAG